MNQPPYEMDSESRAIVLQAPAEVCSDRGWNLLAAHVRTHHVPVIVAAEVRPEKVMMDGKQPGRRRWAGHESTRWLWRDQDVGEAIRQVVERQGEPMAGLLGEVL